VINYQKGKSALMIFARHTNFKYKYVNRHFGCRRYYVDTVGRNKSNTGMCKIKHRGVLCESMEVCRGMTPHRI